MTLVSAQVLIHYVLSPLCSDACIDIGTRSHLLDNPLRLVNLTLNVVAFILPHKQFLMNGALQSIVCLFQPTHSSSTLLSFAASSIIQLFELSIIGVNFLLHYLQVFLQSYLPLSGLFAFSLYPFHQCGEISHDLILVQILCYLC